jgi:hypothetical protein
VCARDAQVEVFVHPGWLLTEPVDVESSWQAHRRVTGTRAA